MKNIAHFVEKFPVQGNEYIYNQVFNSDKVNSILIAEWLTGGVNSFNIPAFCRQKLSGSSFLNRVNHRLNDGIFNKSYIKKFNTFAEKVLEDNRVSVMHAHFGMAGYKLLDVREKLGIPLVVSFYGVDVSCCIRSEPWISRFRRLFEAADRFIVFTENSKDRFMRLGCPEKKIVMSYIPLDIAKFEYQKRTPKKEVKFLTVARFVEKKGLFILLGAFKRILDINKNTSLTLIGHGPLKDKLSERIRDLGIGNRVTLKDTAGIDNIYELFKDALACHDVFVLPAIVAKNGDEDTMPLVISTAQASGLPVISTTVGGITRAIKDNETGFLTSPGDTSGLAEKMDFLIRNKDLWNQVGARARMLVETNNALTVQRKKLEELYLSLRDS